MQIQSALGDYPDGVRIRRAGGSVAVGRLSVLLLRFVPAGGGIQHSAQKVVITLSPGE